MVVGAPVHGLVSWGRGSQIARGHEVSGETKGLVSREGGLERTRWAGRWVYGGASTQIEGSGSGETLRLSLFMVGGGSMGVGERVGPVWLPGGANQLPDRVIEIARRKDELMGGFPDEGLYPGGRNGLVAEGASNEAS